MTNRIAAAKKYRNSSPRDVQRKYSTTAVADPGPLSGPPDATGVATRADDGMRWLRSSTGQLVYWQLPRTWAGEQRLRSLKRSTATRYCKQVHPLKYEVGGSVGEAVMRGLRR